MSKPFSLRVTESTDFRLKALAKRAGIAPRTLAQRYVEEGLRMDEHPMIYFADGPAGRRARVHGTGADVWELIETVRDNDGDVAEAAACLEIPVGVVQAAVAYYGAYPSEVDERIEGNAAASAQAEALWRAGAAAVDN